VRGGNISVIVAPHFSAAARLQFVWADALS